MNPRKAAVLTDLGPWSSGRWIRDIAEFDFGSRVRLNSPYIYVHEEACISGTGPEDDVGAPQHPGSCRR